VHDDTGSRTALAPAVTAVLGSDPHDFAGLYIRHRASFTSHARRYLRDPRDADEVVQDAFLRLFLAMPELESELQALAYCRRTITNLCIDRYRADARRPRLVALEGAPVEDLADDDTGDPVVRAEDAALVRAALSQLPALHRAALVKREIEEKPLPVIADELEVAEDSVKHLLFRARRTLRKLLAGTSVAPGIDVELTRGLRPAARGASGGVAGLLLLALLGLGSGPDLRSVPVVGVDLPDVLGVTAVADAVGGAVRDAVGALVPGEQEQDSAAGRDRDDRPVSRSQPLTPGADDQPAGPAGSSGAVAGTPGRGPATGPAAPSGVTGGGRTSTVVTVVDGVPVVTTVPAPSGPLPAPGAATAPQSTVPGTSTGRAPLASLPVPVGPRSPASGRDVSAPTTVTPVAPGVAAPARPSVPGTSGRTDDAAEAADKAADRAADAAEKAARAADKGAEKTAKDAAKDAEKAADVAQKADKAAEQAADKAQKDARQAAEKAQKDAQQAAEKAQKDAQQAAEKAQQAAEKASKDAAKEAEKAAKAAGDRSAERAATQREASERAGAERAAARAAERAAERAPAATPVAGAASATAP
jgi:RNA polymerase sigma factor (sigma-70 family)